MTAVLESVSVLHPRVQRWVTLAKDLSWQVSENRGSITLLSPTGERVKLHAQPTPEQFPLMERQIAASGLEEAAAAAVTAADVQRVQVARDTLAKLGKSRTAPKVVFKESTAAAATAQEATPSSEAGYDPLQCPECTQEGAFFLAKNGQGLGAHRSKKHSIKGTSRRALNASTEKVPAIKAPTKAAASKAPVSRPPRVAAVSALEQVRSALDEVTKHEAALQARILELEARVAQAESSSREKDTAVRDAKKKATSAERDLAAEKRFGDKVVNILSNQDLSPLRMVSEIMKAAPNRFK